jgi:hypothetical protein
MNNKLAKMIVMGWGLWNLASPNVAYANDSERVCIVAGKEGPTVCEYDMDRDGDFDTFIEIKYNGKDIGNNFYPIRRSVAPNLNKGDKK